MEGTRLMAKGFDVKNNMKVRALSKRLNLEVNTHTSMAVEEAMSYLKTSFEKRDVDTEERERNTEGR